MDELKLSMRREAEAKYGKISPCGGKKTLDDCYSFFKDWFMFWFNSQDGSTHIIRKTIPVPAAK
jgi:hypothetical protein